MERSYQILFTLIETGAVSNAITDRPQRATERRTSEYKSLGHARRDYRHHIRSHARTILFRGTARFCRQKSLNRMAWRRGKCVSRLKRVLFSFIIKALLVTLRTRGPQCIFMSYTIDMHLDAYRLPHKGVTEWRVSNRGKKKVYTSLTANRNSSLFASVDFDVTPRYELIDVMSRCTTLPYQSDMYFL